MIVLRMWCSHARVARRIGGLRDDLFLAVSRDKRRHIYRSIGQRLFYESLLIMI
jgi:hypothetical protein